MADKKPKYTTVTRPKEYWMSPRALSITLNALNEANRIAASVASGAQFFCHLEDLGDPDAEEVFGYDVGHNFPSWPLVIVPTYFNTNKAIYPHVAIPRHDNGNAQAMVVFPTEILDLWGYATYSEKMKDEDGNYIDEYGNIVDDADDAATAYIRKKQSGSTTEDADPVGSDDYYYIFLHGRLKAPFTRGGMLVRDWDYMYDTGQLKTDETWGEMITLEQLAKEMKKKVDVEWFQRIFTIHGTGRKRHKDPDDDSDDPDWETDKDGNIIYSGDDDEERIIKPNDMDHEITDTESVFGFWTEEYISALGKGDSEGGGGALDLNWPLNIINEAELAKNPAENMAIVSDGLGGFKWGKTGGSLSGLTLKDDTDTILPLSQTSDSVTYDLATKFLSLKHGGTMKGDLLIKRTTPISDFTDKDDYVLTLGETKTFFEGKYVTVEFFESLFEVYNGTATSGNKIATNGTIPSPSTNVNIKAMFGFWTEQYISALGQGSSQGGGTLDLFEPLNSINKINRNPSDEGQTLVWMGAGQGINNSGWGFGTAGIDETEVNTLIGEYLRGVKWWGQSISNKVVKGNIEMDNGDSIQWKTPVSGYLSMASLKTENNNLMFILGEGTITNNIPTYLRGSSIYFQTASGSASASLTSDGLFTVNGSISVTQKLYLYKPNAANDTGAVYLEYVQTGDKKGVHLAGDGFYSDSFVSALGTGTSGSDIFDLDPLLNSLHSSGLNPSVQDNQVLVCNNGQWRWEPYGGGSVTNISSLTIKSATTNAVVYNPADTQAATLTVNGQKENNVDVLKVTADSSAHTLTVALSDNYGDTKNPYAAKGANLVLAGPTTGTDRPAWRRLSPSDISDLSLDAQTGVITIGSNTITPLTDAKLKSGYLWWGQQMKVVNQQNVVKGDMVDVGSITMTGDINMNRGKKVLFKIGTNRSGGANDYVGALEAFGDYEVLALGYHTTNGIKVDETTTYTTGSDGKGYSTSIYGKQVSLYYGSTLGIRLNNAGNVGIGTTTDPGDTKLYVNGNIRTGGDPGNWIQIGQLRLIYEESNGSKFLRLADTSSNGGTANFYATGSVSALGNGTSTGAFDLDPLLNSLHSSGLSPSGQSGMVLVNTNGSWSWEKYGGGDSTTGDYLPLIIPGSGKTVSMPSIGALTFKSSASDYPLVRFEGKTSGGLGFIGIGKTGNTINPYYVTAVDGVYKDAKDYPDNHSEWYILVHSGNVGAYAVTSLGTDGDDLTWTKNGTANSLTVPYATYTRRLGQTTLDGTASLSSFKHSTDLIYTAKGGGNTVKDTPSGVTAFGVISMKVADGYYGQLLYSSTGSLHCRASNSLEGVAWKTIAFTDGTIAKADRLSGTADKKAWGRTYWSNGQPTSISGNLENVDEIFMNANKFIRIKDSESNYINMIGMDGSNNFSVFWGALAKGYTTGLYGNLVYIGHGHSGSNPAYYTSFQPNGHVTINAYDKTGYFLTVGGNSFANTVVGKQLKTDEGTAGETVVLNTSATYDCIVYQINGSSKWSVGADSNNNFYWYSQPAPNKTVMSLSSAGRLKVEELQIGDITISVEKQNNTSIGLRVSKGLAATTYISALGTGSSESGGGADLTTVWQSLSSNQAPYQNTQIDIHHFDTTLDSYLSGKSYATLTDIKSYVKTISWSTDTGHTNQLKYTNGNNSSTYVTIGYATKAGSTESASKLSGNALGPFSVWGQEYWSNGIPKNVGTLDNYAPMSYVSKINDLLYLGNSRVGVGTGADLAADSKYKFYVDGSSGLSGGAKMNEICIECASDGSENNGYHGEIDNFVGTLYLQYSRGDTAQKVSLCYNGAQVMVGPIKNEGHFSHDGLTNNITPQLYVSGTIGATGEVYAKGLELYNSDNPHIDFHNGNSNADFTSRITEKKVTVSGSSHYCLAFTPKTTGEKVGLSVGNGTNGDYIKIGGATLTWDGSALKIDTGFYSESFISALGTGSSGGGGDGMTEDQMWSALSNGSGHRIGQNSRLDSLNAYTGYFHSISVNGSSVLTSADLSGYVDTSTQQQIGGSKTFTSAVTVNANAAVNSLYLGQDSGNGWYSVQTRNSDASMSISANIIYLNTGEGAYLNNCLTVGQTSLNTGYNLYVNGTGYFSNNLYVGDGYGRNDVYFKRYDTQGGGILDIYCPQGARLNARTTVTSDIRKKDVVSMVDDLTVEGVARSPIFNFRWKDRPNGSINVGTSAQYWKTVLPNVVIDVDDVLSMDYSATALAAAVTTARTVLTHEEEIKALKQRISELEGEVEHLKAAA